MGFRVVAWNKQFGCRSFARSVKLSDRAATGVAVGPMQVLNE